jgi:glucose dehydrogenase
VDVGPGAAEARRCRHRHLERGSAGSIGGANAWSVIVADAGRNLIYVPTSSPSHDYYGGERSGDNLFARRQAASMPPGLTPS